MKTIGNVQAEANSEVFAVASGAIGTDVSCIVNSDGTVSVVAEVNVSSSAGTPVDYAATSASNQNRVAYDSGNDRIVVVQSGGSITTAIVGTVNAANKSISFGTAVQVAAHTCGYIDVCYNSNQSKVVIAYNHNSADSGHAVVGTVDASDNSISFGSVTALNGGTAVFHLAISSNSDAKVLVSFQTTNSSGTGWSQVGSISGTGISFGSAARFNSGASTDHCSTETADTNVHIICYKDKGNSNYGSGVVATISGTSVSFGSEVVFQSTNTVLMSDAITYNTKDSKGVVGYYSGSGVQKIQAITVSGTTPSFGTARSISASTQPALTYDSAKNRVVASMVGSSSEGIFIVLVPSSDGSTFTAETAVQYEAGSTEEYGIGYDSTAQKVITVYEDGGDSLKGKAVVFEAAHVGTTLTSENYIGISNAAYADTQTATIQAGGAVNTGQSSLTIGQQYFVQGDGTLGLSADDPSVIAGTAVSATDIIVKG
tara:strand:+ start:5137 stop:6591 length:1455 start_codon:yes stop_codon:yes gene_type:complete